MTHYRERKRAKRAKDRERRLEGTYGLTSEEYRAIYEHQGSRCAICQVATGKTKALAVDHDHREPFLIRGLLCSPCNILIGRWGDDPAPFERAISYLASPPALAVIGERQALLELEGD
ncbi:endonuclease VII domain-containing protein [Tsukamurella tyrosinosolvens]|uniref:endonuclease VII domain-containing protein n=1 Tax=Tsukamurella tyrosinosolvens TaxID=57704 RepID=UPI003462EE84